MRRIMAQKKDVIDGSCLKHSERRYQVSGLRRGKKRSLNVVLVFKLRGGHNESISNKFSSRSKLVQSYIQSLV